MFRVTEVAKGVGNASASLDTLETCADTVITSTSRKREPRMVSCAKVNYSFSNSNI